MEELRGLLILLSEAHILYDVIEETAFLSEVALPSEAATRRLRRYPLVIVPDMAQIGPVLAAALEAYLENGGRLLLTGLSVFAWASGQGCGPRALRSCGVSVMQRREHTPGAYFAITQTDHTVLPSLEAVDWIPLDSAWLDCTPAEGAQAFLRFVPVGMYGPPEKCYYTEITDRPGLIVQRSGDGICAVLPWQIGSQYFRFPTHAIAHLFQEVLNGALELHSSIQLEAPPTVKISAFTRKDYPALLIGLVNLSGQNGRATHSPLPVHGLRFRLQESAWARQVETLTQGTLAMEQTPEGDLIFSLPRLDLVEMIRIS